jgi:hypothetical protein
MTTVLAAVIANQMGLVLRSAAVNASDRCTSACTNANKPAKVPAQSMTRQIQ